MSTAVLRLGYKAIQNKITSVHVIKINWKLVYFLVLLCCSIMLIFYIFGVNTLTQGTFLIKNYNKEIDTILVENRNLQTDFAETNFLDKARVRTKELSFQEITKVKYIQILQSALAKAK